MTRRVLLVLSAIALLMIGLGVGYLAGQQSLPTAIQPGPVDIGFSQDMSTHHSQAIEMTDIVAANPDPGVTAMAARIRTTQLEEIGRMQGFLTLWGQSAIPTTSPMAWMNDAHAEHAMNGMPMLGTEMTGAAMPGLATQDQLSRLRSLTGNAQAVLFLQLMLRHHQGGVQMADYAAQHAVLPEVRALAAKMSFDQQQENQMLSQLLQSLGVDPQLPPS